MKPIDNRWYKIKYIDPEYKENSYEGIGRCAGAYQIKEDKEFDPPLVDEAVYEFDHLELKDENDDIDTGYFEVNDIIEEIPTPEEFKTPESRFIEWIKEELANWDEIGDDISEKLKTLNL